MARKFSIQINEGKYFPFYNNREREKNRKLNKIIRFYVIIDWYLTSEKLFGKNFCRIFENENSKIVEKLEQKIVIN